MSDDQPTSSQPPEPPASEPVEPAAPAVETSAAAPAQEETSAAAPAQDETTQTPTAADAASESPEAAAPSEPTEAVTPSTSTPPGAEPEPVASETPARRRASGEDEADQAPARVKPAVPGADLEVDIVPEGVDPLARQSADPYAVEDDDAGPVAAESPDDETVHRPIEQVAIDLAAGARYRATGKRKTAIARVTLQPGTGAYTVNGKTLDVYFPRPTLQRNIRQPLETVGYQDRMDVIARLHGGGVSAQGGALRHGISRALLEADPNLRGELKRRGFLTRDARAKERKKAGLKKARKRPQFSKR